MSSSLFERLQAEMASARKAQDKPQTLLLSTIISDAKNRKIELMRDLTDDDVVDVIRKGIKRRRESVEMFEKGGELAIFRRSGMNPVFMGQSLAGAKLPNLTYMLAFDDQAAYDKGWKAFRDDPEWKKLSKDDTYKDTVSTITNLILRPATRSQI